MFRWPSISVINSGSNRYYMIISFRTFKISWNKFFLNYLCWSWAHGWHLVDYSISLFRKSFTLSKVHASILSTLLIVLIGFPRCGMAFYDGTAHACIWNKLNNVRHDQMLSLNTDHSILQTSRVDCSPGVIEQFQQALSVIIPSQQLLVSSKQSRTYYK